MGTGATSDDECCFFASGRSFSAVEGDCGDGEEGFSNERFFVVKGDESWMGERVVVRGTGLVDLTAITLHKGS